MLEPFSYNTALGRSASAEVYSISGEVIDINRNVKTHLNVSGGGSYSSSGNGRAYSSTQPINVNSSNSVHDDVFIVDRSGKEYHLTLINWEHVGIRKGHHIQVLSVHNIRHNGYSKVLKNLDDYVAVYNKSLNKIFYNNKLMKQLATPPLKDSLIFFLKHTIFPKYMLVVSISLFIFGFDGSMGVLNVILCIGIPIVLFISSKLESDAVIAKKEEVVQNTLKPILNKYLEY